MDKIVNYLKTLCVGAHPKINKQEENLNSLFGAQTRNITFKWRGKSNNQEVSLGGLAANHLPILTSSFINGRKN